MGLTEFPRGITSMGIPIVGGRYITTGDIHFADNATGSNATDRGGDRDHAFGSIEYGIGQCTASKDDFIFAMPGHTETVGSAGALDCDVIGVTIVGIGSGTIQPIISLTAETSDIDIDAASITFENVNFQAAYADVSVGIDLNSTDFTLRNCRFTESTAGKNCEIWIQDDDSTGTSRLTIEGCHCLATDAENDEFVALGGTGDGHIIRNNVLLGNWDTACLSIGGVVTLAQITHNFIMNSASTSDACIKAHASATGIVAWNATGGGAAQANGIVANGMAKIENYYVDLSDASGIIDPIAT